MATCHTWVRAKDKLEASRPASRFRDGKRDCFAYYCWPMATNISAFVNFKFSSGLVFVFKEETMKDDVEDKTNSLFPKFPSLTTISELPFTAALRRFFVWNHSFENIWPQFQVEQSYFHVNLTFSPWIVHKQRLNATWSGPIVTEHQIIKPA